MSVLRIIAAFIRRVVQWLGSLISRMEESLRPKRLASGGSTGPELGETVSENHSSPSTPWKEAEQTSQQRGDAPDEIRPRTDEVPREVAPPGNGVSTPLRAPAETRPAVGNEKESEPQMKSGLPSRTDARVPAEPSNANDQKTSDTTQLASDGSTLAAPGSQAPAEVELENGHDDAREGLKDKAEDAKRAVVPPGKRGGRPRGTTQADKRQRQASSSTASSRPEIVCWKRAREWVVGIEIPGEILQSSNLTVRQGDITLSKDAARAGCWPLATLTAADEIQVSGASDNRPIDKLQLGDLLIFKLSGGRLERGRKVRRVSSGSYLAIVSDAWRRDEEKAGSAPTSPEPVFLEGYQAHFFEIEPPSCIAFRDERAESIVIGSRETQFHLVGSKIHDASGRLGPLFGDLPPRLGITNGDWSNVKTIVVGQEGSSQQRWRKSFKPRRDQTTQVLPQEVLDRKAGWYFVRFYDPDDTLIDSLDFRFVAGLKGILVTRNDPVPSKAGHGPSTVEILCDAGYSVTPSGQECPDLRVDHTNGKTLVTIPPRAACDLTRWSIRPKDRPQQEVTVDILVERIWWALAKIDANQWEWTDGPIELCSEDFAATSDKAIWLRFPRPRWISSVSAGFRRQDARDFPVLVANDVVLIPLRDFSGAQELGNGAAKHEFKVWLRTEQHTHDVTVAVLLAEAVDGSLDLTAIPAHRLATVLTKLRRAVGGPTRRLIIKEVRRKYRRGPRARRARNEEFVKKALCLIAMLIEDAQGEQQVGSRWFRHWQRKAELARRENPALVQQLRARLSETGRR